MFKNRKAINFLSGYYYKLTPSFVLKSKKFHQVLYRILIGKWFNVDFKKEYKKYTDKDWEKLYDLLFVNRIREDDLTTNQRKFVLENILGPSVLEVGCGTGTIIEKILTKGKIKEIVGNDISPKVISYLTKKFKNYPRVSFRQGDFTKISVKEKFSTVLCLHVLEHVEDCQKMANFLIKASLKRVIVIVPREAYYRYPPNYHLQFFNENNPVTKLFPKRKNILKMIDGDFVLISDR